MTIMLSDKQIIGRVEKVRFPFLGARGVHARVDTGAQTSSIWASKVIKDGKRLGVVFFGENSEHFDGAMHYFEDFESVMVASSNGQAEPRYKVRMTIKIGGRRIRAHFTLADRSVQVYPVLIGRNILRGKFVVDVKQGKARKSAERARSQDLQSRLADS